MSIFKIESSPVKVRVRVPADKQKELPQRVVFNAQRSSHRYTFQSYIIARSRLITIIEKPCRYQQNPADFRVEEMVECLDIFLNDAHHAILSSQAARKQ